MENLRFLMVELSLPMVKLRLLMAIFLPKSLILVCFEKGIVENLRFLMAFFLLKALTSVYFKKSIDGEFKVSDGSFSLESIDIRLFQKRYRWRI
jgi:hypothetical protein